ncbi:MAG: hypothetical protein ACLP9S_17065 [Syntrophales bacterium]
MGEVKYVNKDGSTTTAIMDEALVVRGCFSCLECGNLLTFYEEKVKFKCDICGKEEESKYSCDKGHYVCESCWKPPPNCPVGRARERKKEQGKE